MIRTLALAALAAISFAGAAGAQTWTPVADSPRGVDAVTAEWPSGVQMVARCTRGRDLDVMMTLGRPVAQPHVAANVVMGETDFPEQRWRLSPDGGVIFARQPLRLSWTFIGQEPVDLQLAPDEGPGHRYVLTPPEGETALAEVLTACGHSPTSPFGNNALITNPDWRSRPSGADLARWYPPEAARNGVTGHAVIECRVAVSGRVEDCIVLSESPEGMGFGAATIGISSAFRMTPMRVNGQPYGETLIRLPMNWRMQ